MATSQLLLVYCAFAGATTGQDLRLPTQVPPAALLDVSGNLINTLIERPVQRVEPVRDIILDACVSGTSQTCGRVFAWLLPNRERAHISVLLQGTSHSDTVGVREHAKAYTHTVTHFDVHQPIFIEDKRVRLACPLARAQAMTSLRRITNLDDCEDSIVVGMGQRTFHQDRPQIESISARKAECKVTASLAQELQPQIAKVSRGLSSAFDLAIGLGIPVQPLRWSTTATHVHGEAGLVTTAPMLTPPPLPGSADLGLRVHQSVLNRMAQTNLAGKTYSVLHLFALRETIVSFLSGTASAPSKGPDQAAVLALLKSIGLDPVSITFTKTAPLEVDLNATGFSIKLNGQSFLQGSEKYPTRIIRARYRIETRPEEIVLVREGSVQVMQSSSPDPDEEKNKKVQVVLEKSFNIFLPDRLILPTITIPVERPLTLVPTHATTSPGWLTLGWTRK